MKKRYLSTVLLAATVFALGACSLTEAENVEGKDQGESGENDKDTEKTVDAPTETTVAGGDGLTVETSRLEVKSADGELLMTLSDSSFIYEDGIAEKYPKFAACLDDESGSRMTELFDSGKRLGEECLSQKEQMGEFAGTMTYFDDTETSVLRFDDTLFVTEDYCSVYYGGAHGMDTYFYTNIDINTGEYVTSSDLIKDNEKVADLIAEALVKEHQDVAEVEWTDDENGDPTEYVRDLVYTEMTEYGLNCTVTDKGFVVFFPPYDLASYAAGYFEVTLDTDENKDCFNEKYLTISNDRKDEVRYTSKDEDDLVLEKMPGKEFYANCPSWDYYCQDYLEAEECHTVIEEKNKTVHTDWTVEDWLENNGFLSQDMPYIDEDLWGIYPEIPYSEEVITGSIPDGCEDDPMYQGVMLEYDPEGRQYHYDLSRLANGPDDKNGEKSEVEMGPLYLKYVAEKNGFLYVELSRKSSPKGETRSSYIAKIDIESGYVEWKSEPLVANADNFVITDNAIICGYGAEGGDNYLCELDINTGEVVNRIKLDKKPDYIIMSGAVLYVWAGDTAYEFDLSEG
ncbi:MAG: RsiV family protein [Lachnospiraceae bacterium]|nr:RsiV family protein [Lachnospiraceae bacterium]